jgi:DNA-binding beta-propeller fold protein YncE
MNQNRRGNIILKAEISGELFLRILCPVLLSMLLGGCNPDNSTAVDKKPVIISFKANPPNAAAKARAILSCDAVDPEGQMLKYSWSARIGNVTPDDSSTVVWTAPDSETVDDVTVRVTDPLGHASSDTLKLVVGPEIWVADYNDNTVTKMAADGTAAFKLKGFLNPSSVSADYSTRKAWVADRGHQKVVILAPFGEVQTSISEKIGLPSSLSVNWSGKSCWVANQGLGTVVLISDKGEVVEEQGGFSQPLDVDVDSLEGYCWVADTGDNEVVKLSGSGDVLLTVANLDRPAAVGINSNDGSCWIAGNGNGEIVKVSKNGSRVELVLNQMYPGLVDIKSCAWDNSAWALYNEPGVGQVVHISESGSELGKWTGFQTPQSITIDQVSKTVWIADSDNGDVFKIDSMNKLTRYPGFKRPVSISVIPPLK